MAADYADEEAAPTRKSRLPLLAGVLLALALGGAGFFAAYSGLLPAGAESAASAEREGGAGHGAGAHSGAPVFVPLEPLVIMLGPAGAGRHLRFRAELEVEPGGAGPVRDLMPRLLDVLHGYLRAVPVADLESPTALVLLRAQMLRRVQLVAGPGRVRDLLVTEFVVN